MYNQYDCFSAALLRIDHNTINRKWTQFFHFHQSLFFQLYRWNLFFSAWCLLLFISLWIFARLFKIVPWIEVYYFWNLNRFYFDRQNTFPILFSFFQPWFSRYPGYQPPKYHKQKTNRCILQLFFTNIFRPILFVKLKRVMVCHLLQE